MIRDGWDDVHVETPEERARFESRLRVLRWIYALAGIGLFLGLVLRG